VFNIYSIGFIRCIPAFILILSCSGQKQVQKDKTISKCNILATVKDFTDLDACTFILQLSNKELLQPVNIDSFKISLKDGDKVMIGYSDQKGMVSACFSGKLVKLNCIRKLDTLQKSTK
jgi:hypothetical protein